MAFSDRIEPSDFFYRKIAFFVFRVLWPVKIISLILSRVNQ